MDQGEEGKILAGILKRVEAANETGGCMICHEEPEVSVARRILNDGFVSGVIDGHVVQLTAIRDKGRKYLMDHVPVSRLRKGWQRLLFGS